MIRPSHIEHTVLASSSLRSSSSCARFPDASGVEQQTPWPNSFPTKPSPGRIELRKTWLATCSWPSTACSFPDTQNKQGSLASTSLIREACRCRGHPKLLLTLIETLVWFRQNAKRSARSRRCLQRSYFCLLLREFLGSCSLKRTVLFRPTASLGFRI